jgi:dihydrolipoamide dehydrogenase
MGDPAHLIVIGGGIGGYTAAIRAARQGLQVTLVEDCALGGTCLNVGCIPTKSLLHSSAMIRALPHHAALAGLEGQITVPPSVFTNLREEKSTAVDRLVGGVRTLLRRNKITHISGRAEFIGPKTLKISGQEEAIDGDVIVIAAGSVVAIPPIDGIDLEDVITSDEAIELTERPDRIAILGGGVIGVEFAQIFANLGTEVTIVEMADDILAAEDREAAALLAKLLNAQGVTIRTGARVNAIAKEKGGVTLSLDGGAEGIEVDKVLVATGRKPNIEGLGLDVAGIETRAGAIAVDDFLRTNVTNVYAVGDITGGPLLAHRAGAQAECAIGHYLGHKVPPMSALAMPRAVYTQPELACVGLTEEEARAQGEIKVGRFPFAGNGRALVLGETSGFVKVIAAASDEQIIGIVMVGPEASNLLGEATLAVQMELTLTALMYTVHAHPTLTEALLEAAHDAHDCGAIHQPPKGKAT